MSKLQAPSQIQIPQISKIRPPATGIRSSPRLNSKRRASDEENIPLSKKPRNGEEY